MTDFGSREFDELNGKKNNHPTFAGGSRCAVGVALSHVLAIYG